MTPPSFDGFGLAEPLRRALNTENHHKPTPIQAQAIPYLTQGKDLLGIAQTGTGKTAAFALPILHRLAAERRPRVPGRPHALILAPTRELACQIDERFRAYGRGLGLKSAVILGGVGQGKQVQALAAGVDILIATPGRLLDLHNQRHVSLAEVSILVLDEADRMLDMGFIEDVERIADRTPKTRQTVLFSATFETAIARLAARLLRDPVRIEIEADKKPPVAIDQRVHFTDDHAHKHRILDHLLADIEMTQSIVFIATKRDAESLAIRLRGDGHAAAALHGDMDQRERTRTLSDMRRGSVRTLVATDVAARGLDVAGISHVINFDLPRQAGDYVHRIGRTGRAGASGVAVSLAAHTERAQVRQIERYTGATIAAHVIPGLEPRRRPSHTERAQPGTRPAPRRERDAWAGQRRDGSVDARKTGGQDRKFNRSR
jgi:superfamily II DNA/RNA helicase